MSIDSAKHHVQWHPILLILLFALALFFRVYHLGSNGLSEDEANKMMATTSYRHGDFTPNGEHPMLMKLLSTGCLIFSEKWNGVFPSVKISPEAALRFPIALAGALGVFAIFLLGRELFNPSCALIAAALWAVDINAVALTRIAKEDPIATLFFILANFFLLRGKRLHFVENAKANVSYIACGVCFGLMFASKYLIPLPWITLIYYDLFRFRKGPKWRIDRKTLVILYACLILVFLLFDFAVVKPEMWTYMWKQFTQQKITHNGYYMMGEIHLNKVMYTLWGVPTYFFPLYLFVKTPIPLLAFFLIGLMYSLRQFREERFLFLNLYFFVWLILLTIPGGKFTRYAITLLPAVILLEALGIYIVYIGISSFLQKRGISSTAPVLLVLLLMTFGWECYLEQLYHPDQSMYVSSQAGGSSRLGYYFPQDDFYDAGLREAIQFMCERAPKGSTAIGTTPVAFQYYQNIFHRPDLKFIALGRFRIHFDSGEKYFLIVQDYRQYLENNYVLTFAHSALNPLFISYVKGRSSVELYFLSRQAPFAKSQFWRTRKWPGLLGSLVESASR